MALLSVYLAMMQSGLDVGAVLRWAPALWGVLVAGELRVLTVPDGSTPSFLRMNDSRRVG